MSLSEAFMFQGQEIGVRVLAKFALKFSTIFASLLSEIFGKQRLTPKVHPGCALI